MNTQENEKKREAMPTSLKEWKPAILFFGFIVIVVVAFAAAAALIDISIYGL